MIWTRGEVEFHRGVFEPTPVLKTKSLRDSEIREDKPLRVFILTLSVLAILTSANAAKAGPSMTDRELLASADPAAVVQEGTQETEDQVGLDKAKRREVQRRLTRLGFDTRVNGRFGKPTRSAIARWQAARGYPNTGFLSTPQHQALLTNPSRRRAPALAAATSPMRTGRLVVAAVNAVIIALAAQLH